MKKIVLIASAALFALSSSALSQSTTTTTTQTTTSTTSTEVPAEVRTYVTEQSTPSVAIEGEILVGEALPDTVEVITIPDNDEYGYAVVNERRVVLDPQTRTVVQVLD